jgi:hypothetical protein
VLTGPTAENPGAEVKHKRMGSEERRRKKKAVKAIAASQSVAVVDDASPTPHKPIGSEGESTAAAVKKQTEQKKTAPTATDRDNGRREHQGLRKRGRSESANPYDYRGSLQGHYCPVQERKGGRRIFFGRGRSGGGRASGGHRGRGV